MSNPRSKGLALILLGALILGGNTLDMLPREAFWAGLFTYPFGAYLFLKGSRTARERAEQRIARKLTPRLANAPGQEHARRQARHVVRPHAPRPLHAPPDPIATRPSAAQGEGDELLLSELERVEPTDGGHFQVTSDVSYPTALQDPGRLADQLEKLGKLQQQGIITKEELAIAKAKLLG